MTGDDPADETHTAPIEPWRAEVQAMLDSAKSFTEFTKALRGFAKTYESAKVAA